MRFRTPVSAAALAAISALALAACVPNDSDSSEGIAVSSTADECKVATDTAAAGPVVFHVTNDGEDVTEFYLLADDGLRIISEVENIGPGITRDLVVRVPEGNYLTACKPGMVGDGIQAAFTVTPSDSTVAPTGDREEQLAAAGDQYILYVRDQVQTLVQKTDEFVAAYESGDYDKARELYADARVHWERIEPVAESFGDLDPKTDAREADLAEGDEWTGWHRIEKHLWPPAEGYELTAAEQKFLADDLKANIATLSDEVNAEDFTLDASQIGNGAVGLLDEVAAGKVTGEEEIWSHTDLWDFQANVDGALVAFGVLRDVVNETDPDLVNTLDTRFDDLNALLAQYGSIDEGFVLYTDLTPDQVKELSDAVNALSEPLSQLTAAAVL
ncbi:iron uptake system protein EfeO [Demequina sp.]|uniref:iron uptake system protein EfeO n=1 Tax=Demequina sp. TaxID=2050685 RepID=UPI003D11E2F1